ncbi:MAG: hypothetical protein PF450_13910 [Bacteroidales bacterium]|jgi:hypothetical protein|nr:hypothetical protein [Bacteroidales bacterium]
MKNQDDKEFFPLFREDYKPTIEHYFIKIPEISSGSAYYFTTESGLEYEVLFAKKRGNYLENIVNFSVLSEDFEDEYSETNRGEVFRVIATVTETVRIYHEKHAYSTSYEFSGEFKAGNENRESSIRTLLYYREAKNIITPYWDINLNGNKLVVSRKKKAQS